MTGPAPSRPPEETSPPLAEATYRLFRLLSRERRARIFHPAGRSFRCEVTLAEGSPLGQGGSRAGLVRFSRAFGLPRPLPDVLGLAFRIEDAHGPGRPQDALLASALGGLVPCPARTFFGPTFSSLLPYEARGARRLIVARAPTREGTGDGDALDELARSNRRLRFDLTLEPYSYALGELVLGEPLSPAESARLRFNPFNTGAELVPVWWPNRFREPAYRGSQAGRPIPG